MDKAREAALKILHAVHQQGAYANVALAKELRQGGLSDMDRRFVTELVYGTVKAGETLDWIIKKYLSRPWKKVNPVVQDILRLGTYQLRYMDKIPVCAHYELDGQQTDEFPFPVCLQDAKPVVEYVDGWQSDISKARSWEDLPENARKYVEYVEKAIGCHIGYVSVGAERDSLIIR